MGGIWEAFWGLLLNILVGINSVIDNPGISIIIFTVFMRLLTVPLTMKSLKSNRNMQQIQPLIKEIQKKYGKDKQKQQEETMKLYQQYGINPAAGCFPMLVQMPVFFGLFAALNFVVHLNTGDATAVANNLAHLRSLLYIPGWEHYATDFNQGFLWLPNLAAPDPIYVMPLLSGVFQFIQSRMSMPRRDPNQVQDAQQKMMNGMMQFMPLYIIFISLNFPSGTVIYWAFSSLFGAVQQYFITGFGTLPDLPGLGWLPRKEIQKPAPLAPLPDVTVASAEVGLAKKSRGMMGWMMDKALEAQEAQKATAQAGPQGEAAGSGKSPGKGSAQRTVKSLPASNKKYASDVRHRENTAVRNGSSSNGNGTTEAVTRDMSLGDGTNGRNGAGAGTRPIASIDTVSQLPRKKRSKR